MAKQEKNSDVIVGLVIGQQKVRAIAAVQNAASLYDILALEEVECNASKVANAESVKSNFTVDYAIRKVLHLLGNRIQKNLGESPIFTCVENDGVVIRKKEVKLDKQTFVSEKLLGQMEAGLKESMEHDNPPMTVYACRNEGIYLDGRLESEPVNKKAKTILGHYSLVMLPKESEQNLLADFESSKVDVNAYFIRPDAYSSVLLDDEEMEEGCAIIDMGTYNTCLSIYKDHQLCFLGNLEHGGNDITQDIENAFEISYSNAEKLKRKIGKAMSKLVTKKLLVKVESPAKGETVGILNTDLAKIIEKRLRQLLRPILAKIQQEGITKVVLTNSGANLLGLPEMIKELMPTIEVRKGSHSRWIASGELSDTPSNNLLMGVVVLGGQRLQDAVHSKPKTSSIKTMVKKSGTFVEGFLSNLFGNENEDY